MVRRPSKMIFIQGPVSKLHIKFTAFYEHLSLKVQDFSKVLSLACSRLGNNCIFVNKICKWRQIHVKTLIFICPTMYFQRLQHQWNNTLKEQCSHLNLRRFWHAKIFQRQIFPAPIFRTFYFENMLHGKIYASFRWEPTPFLSPLHARHHTLEKSCTFKVKCLANTEIFICNLLNEPFNRNEF